MGWTEWERIEKYGSKDIIYEKKYHSEGGGVGRITINRPNVYNAFTGDTIDEICIALDDASHDETLGVVVLTGAGDKAFCTGGDVSWEKEGQDDPRRGSRFVLSGGRPVVNSFVRRCRKPVIAAVKGYAIGGGHHLAYMCDFTVAADNAKFGQTGPRVGSPADGLCVAYLTFVVGAKKAREIWMLTKQYSAEEALDMGLVNAVVPLEKLDEEVDSWCERILAHSPECISILKATFDSVFDYLDGSLGRFQNLISPDFFDGMDVREAQSAFFEKRKPNFWKHRPR